MNILSPRTWFGGPARKSNPVGSSAVVRAGRELGPFQATLGGFVARKVNPVFYEALREAIGPLDGAITKTVTLDGIIGVEGDNDALVQLIDRELVRAIPVNDMAAGLQAFYAGQGGELYEQGCGVGEMVFDTRGRELIGLRVADSKGIAFLREDDGTLSTWYRPPAPKRGGRADGSDAVETVLRSGLLQVTASSLVKQGYTPLAPNALVYAALHPENDGPYGVSLLRSVEFVAQILLMIQNASGQAWKRFGDPVFHVNYKTKNRAVKGDELEKRRLKLAGDLGAAMKAKAGGNSADFVTAIGADDDISVTVIGADGEALELEMPARHMMEQILAKVDLPAWMLGMQWSTAERMADQQSEMVLQGAKTRFESRQPGLDRIVATWLRGRGKTWKHGDWKLIQRLPNLRDELKRAQAGFLRAQTQMMLGGNGRVSATDPTLPPENDPPESDPGPKGMRLRMLPNGVFEWDFGTPKAAHTHKAGDPIEPWAVDDPELPRIEGDAIAALLSAWHTLRDRTLAVLQLPDDAGKAPGVTFVFDALNVLAQLLLLRHEMVDGMVSPQGEFLVLAFESWARGVANAAARVDQEAAVQGVIEASRAAAQRDLLARAMPRVDNAAIRTYRTAIVDALARGAYDGMNPREVARLLRKQFGDLEYDWERLARSEIARSQSQGQLDAMPAMGVTEYDFEAAPGHCPICGELEANGPYEVGKGPIPVDDSHPSCRCSVAPRAPV